MSWRQIGNYFRLLCAIGWLAASSVVAASEYHGQVTFGVCLSLANCYFAHDSLPY